MRNSKYLCSRKYLSAARHLLWEKKNKKNWKLANWKIVGNDKPISKIISRNFEVLHKACLKAFIAVQNSEEIRRVFSHNTWTTCKMKYISGNQVYFKHAKNHERYGPAKVLGQEGQKVLIKKGKTCGKCWKEELCLATIMITSSKWNLFSLEFKNIFLQGKVRERVVHVRSPQEANTNFIWSLRKCIYGLANASRYQYLRLREQLVKWG